MARTATKPKKSKEQTRIDALRARAEAECKDSKCEASGVCKHEGEKAAARAALTRYLAKAQQRQIWNQDAKDDEQAAMWRRIYERGYDDHGHTYWIGSNHNKGKIVDTAVYAASIRAEIKLRRKLARLPLVPETDGNGTALSIQAVELYAFDPIAEAPPEVKFYVTTERGGGGYSGIQIAVKAPVGWGWTESIKTDHQGREYTDYDVTDDMRVLARELRALGQSYNADHGSDFMTDCWVESFNVSVDAIDPRGWHTGLGY